MKTVPFTLKDQTPVLREMILATFYDYARLAAEPSHPIVIGSGPGGLTLRHYGYGAPLAQVLERYGIEPLLAAPLLKINSFRDDTNAELRFDGGQPRPLRVRPDVAPAGILIHADWDDFEVAPVTTDILRAILCDFADGFKLPWKPAVRLNGEMLDY